MKLAILIFECSTPCGLWKQNLKKKFFKKFQEKKIPKQIFRQKNSEKMFWKKKIENKYSGKKILKKTIQKNMFGKKNKISMQLIVFIFKCSTPGRFWKQNVKKKFRKKHSETNFLQNQILKKDILEKKNSENFFGKT